MADSSSVHFSTTDGFADFEFEPLDLAAERPSIRLAHIQPADHESPIHVQLTTVTFTDRPIYKALSYTWGKPEPVNEIWINGISVCVRENLWSALWHLRDLTDVRILWIDAICINQADIDERNHQVTLMAYIYSRAEEVIVWLGIALTGTKTWNKDRGITLSADAIRVLCNHPYWRRVWIVQEIGAAMELKVYYGLVPADIRGFGPVGYQQAFTWEKFAEKVRTSGPLDNNPAWKLIKQRESRHGESYELVNLLEVCQDSLCAEPRDKVYGFLSIAHDCQAGSLANHYGKSLFDVWEDVVIFQVQSNPKKLIRCSQLVQQAFSLAMLEPIDRYQGSHVFKVFGLYSGLISIIGPKYEDFVGIPDALKKWKASLSECKVNIEQLRRKNEGFTRVVLHLDNSDLSKIRPIIPSFILDQDEPMQEIVDKIRENEGVEIFLPREENWPRVGPRLFATVDGQIGLIPDIAQKYDMLFQFHGSDVVAVVRVEGQHQLKIIGRAVLANDTYVETQKFRLPPDAGQQTPIELRMDTLTLQQMTC